MPSTCSTTVTSRRASAAGSATGHALRGRRSARGRGADHSSSVTWGQNGPSSRSVVSIRLAQERRPLRGRHVLARPRLERVERVDQLHDGADRRVEVEVALDVVGDPLDRLVNRPPERPPLAQSSTATATSARRRSWMSAVPRRRTRPARPRSAEAPRDVPRQSSTPDSETGWRLDAVVVPVEVLFRRRREQRERVARCRRRRSG